MARNTLTTPRDSVRLVTVGGIVDGPTSTLRDSASVRERRLMDAYLRCCSLAALPVVALDRQTMIVNDSAGKLGLERSTVWAAVATADPWATEIPLTAEFVGLPYPVTPGQFEHGVVLVLRRRTAASSAPPPVRSPILHLGPLEDAERQVIVETLVQCGGNKKDAAAKLGISRGTLYQRIRRYRLLG